MRDWYTCRLLGFACLRAFISNRVLLILCMTGRLPSTVPALSGGRGVCTHEPCDKNTPGYSVVKWRGGRARGVSRASARDLFNTTGANPPYLHSVDCETPVTSHPNSIYPVTDFLKTDLLHRRHSETGVSCTGFVFSL